MNEKKARLNGSVNLLRTTKLRLIFNEVLRTETQRCLSDKFCRLFFAFTSSSKLCYKANEAISFLMKSLESSRLRFSSVFSITILHKP